MTTSAHQEVTIAMIEVTRWLEADGWSCDCSPGYPACVHLVECISGAESAIKKLVLVVHVEACEETSGDGYSGPWSYCGDSFQIGKVAGVRGQRIDMETPWYCDIAERLKT